jgi:hypothetical protein
MAKILRPFSFIKVRTSDGRYRHTMITEVTDQDTITSRIGLANDTSTVSSARVASTTTRGTEFQQT